MVLRSSGGRRRLRARRPFAWSPGQGEVIATIRDDFGPVVRPGLGRDGALLSRACDCAPAFRARAHDSWRTRVRARRRRIAFYDMSRACVGPSAKIRAAVPLRRCDKWLQSSESAALHRPLAVHTAGTIRGAAARIVHNVMAVLATGFAATATPARRRGGARALQKGSERLLFTPLSCPPACLLHCAHHARLCPNSPAQQKHYISAAMVVSSRPVLLRRHRHRQCGLHHSHLRLRRGCLCATTAAFSSITAVFIAAATTTANDDGDEWRR
jgi:hypothetical protein